MNRTQIYRMLAHSIAEKFIAPTGEILCCHEGQAQIENKNCTMTVSVYGELCSISIDIYRSHIPDVQTDFLTLVRILDQLLPKYRLEEGRVPINKEGDTSAISFNLRTGAGAEISLVCSFNGSLSKAEESHLRHFLLLQQKLKGEIYAELTENRQFKLSLSFESLERRYKLVQAEHVIHKNLYSLSEQCEASSLDQQATLHLGSIHLTLAALESVCTGTALNVPIPQRGRGIIGRYAPKAVGYQIENNQIIISD